MTRETTQGHRQKIKPLTEVGKGKLCRLVSIARPPGRRHPLRHHRRRRGGRRRTKEKCPFREIKDREDREMIRRLLDLGLTSGCTFQIIQGGGRGPVLVDIRGTRIALGNRLASRLMVEVVSE